MSLSSKLVCLASHSRSSRLASALRPGGRIPSSGSIRPSVLRENVRQNRQFSGCFTSNFSTSGPESLSVRLRLTIDPRVCGFNVNARYLHGSTTLNDKASSKVEETVNRLKEKHEKNQQEASAAASLQGKPKPLGLENQSVKNVVVKKTLWQRVVAECQHYYSGFKLLFLDVRVCSGILWKILNGKALSRRESRQLVRTTSDLFRLVPFSVFIIVPFMELLLPVALKLFPGMLPSTFTTKSEREAKLKRTLAAKLEYAKFLQKTLDEMALSDSKSRDSKSASDFVEFYQKIKSQGVSIVNNEEILKYSKLFEDDITLDNMTRGQLSAICRLLELTPIGTSNFLRLQIEMRLRHLKADDRVILKEGLNNMTVQELQVANKERGMKAYGLSEPVLKRQLEEWLDLSMNAKVPPSLLLLSRTLYLSETALPSEQIAATISALPESAASATKVQISEREGKIRNVERLAQIKQEQQKIKEEEAENRKMDEIQRKVEQATAIAKKAAVQSVLSEAAGVTSERIKFTSEIVDAPPVTVETLLKEATGTLKKATVTITGDVKEVLVDTAPILNDKAEVLLESLKDGDSVKAEKDFKASDLSDLKSAVASLSKPTTLRANEIKTLKKELEDYEEDLKNLKSAKEVSQRHSLSETKGAKRLFSRVNKMLNRVDYLVEKLEDKEKEISAKKTIEGRSEEEVEIDEENLVTVQELIDAVIKLQQTPDSSKLKQISEVLSLMDVDEDGIIRLEHVNKVIELIGTESVNIPAKQIRQIIDMMTKEEMLDVELKIEQILKHGESTEHETAEEQVLTETDIKHPESGESDEGHEEEQLQKHQKNGGKPSN